VRVREINLHVLNKEAKIGALETRSAYEEEEKMLDGTCKERLVYKHEQCATCVRKSRERERAHLKMERRRMSMKQCVLMFKKV
jgi:hypothetical protein